MLVVLVCNYFDSLIPTPPTVKTLVILIRRGTVPFDFRDSTAKYPVVTHEPLGSRLLYHVRRKSYYQVIRDFEACPYVVAYDTEFMCRQPKSNVRQPPRYFGDFNHVP
jgi:hypothetical protein